MLQFQRFVFSSVSYQEYTQKHKNQLKPSRNKYAIFIKLLHYYISKLSNTLSHLLALFQNISKSCTFLPKFLNILLFLNIFFFLSFLENHMQSPTLQNSPQVTCQKFLFVCSFILNLAKLFFCRKCPKVSERLET